MATAKVKLLGVIQALDTQDAEITKRPLGKTYDHDEVSSGQFTLERGGTAAKRVVVLDQIATPQLVHIFCDQTFELELPTATSLGNFQHHVVLGLPTNRAAATFAVTMIATVTAAPVTWFVGATA